MNFFFDLERVVLFVLLLARATGLVVVAPFFGERIVPRKVKMNVILLLAILMTFVAPESPLVPENLVGLGLIMAAELSVGLAIGFVARLILLSFEMAGSIISVQMGFAMARIVDPMQSNPTTVMGRFMWLIGLTLFLGLNGHHILLRAVAGSLEILPVGTGLFGEPTLALLIDLAAASLTVGMSIAAPVIGVLLMTSAGLGILARTVPQMNVFIVGFPLKIAAGIIGLGLSLPYVLDIARREVAGLARQLTDLMLAA